jgi:hypothetical protein
MKSSRNLFALVAAALASPKAVNAAIIDIGGDIGWMEGICYQNIEQVRVGDILRFAFGGHDVYRLSSKSHFQNCDFSDSLLLAGVGSSPFEYEVTSVDIEGGELYFACSVGDHCAGGTQKVTVKLEPDLGQALTDVQPESQVLFGLSAEACAEVHENASEGSSDGMQLDSECSEPVLQEDGRYYVSCLSPRATLTPGGVINNLFILHYPYPKDKRVLVGLRTWEFVQDVQAEGEEIRVEAVPVNRKLLDMCESNIDAFGVIPSNVVVLTMSAFHPLRTLRPSFEWSGHSRTRYGRDSSQ